MTTTPIGGTGEERTIDELRARLLEPLAIGALELDRRIFMAPMAGISVAAFRRSARRAGAGLVFTEMISAHGIVHANRRTLAYLDCGADEHPIGFQLFAADPAALAGAARTCLSAGADLVDLNMACPVRKVMKTGAGAALLGAPDLAVACVAAVVEAVAGAVPVTVKIRSGLRDGDEAGRRLAPRLVAAGAAAVCLHPRSAAQLYRGRADHAVTLSLAAELPVPVIASGDVAVVGADDRPDRELIARLLAGGVAAVMVARAALGRPWVFAELLEGQGGRLPAALLAALPAQRRAHARARRAAHVGRRRRDCLRSRTGRMSPRGTARSPWLAAAVRSPIIPCLRGPAASGPFRRKKGCRRAGTRDHPHPSGVPAPEGRDRVPLDQEA
jgi:nifR3 family TIM-barrel protein